MMRRLFLLFLCGLVLAVLTGGPGLRLTQAQANATPTPPPPPVAEKTPTVPLPPPGGGGGKKTPTATLSLPPGGTPVPFGTPLSTASPPSSPTATLTATLTPTPTVPPTLLRLVVFMDANGNGDFDTGEGVDNLLALARWETWQTYGYTADGYLTFTVPADLPAGAQIAVEAPYLHWSSQVKAPELSGVADTALKLALPEFPVFLP